MRLAKGRAGTYPVTIWSAVAVITVRNTEIAISPGRWRRGRSDLASFE